MITLGYPLLLAGSVAAGSAIASQAGVNSRLRQALHSALQVAFISFCMGALLLGLLSILQGAAWFDPAKVAELPWWAWIGGALGVFNVVMSVFLAPRLGALTLNIAIVCGQVLASLVLDQNGWLGYPRIDLSTPRIVGAMLIVAGVILVAKKKN